METDVFYLPYGSVYRSAHYVMFIKLTVRNELSCAIYKRSHANVKQRMACEQSFVSLFDVKTLDEVNEQFSFIGFVRNRLLFD